MAIQDRLNHMANHLQLIGQDDACRTVCDGIREIDRLRAELKQERAAWFRTGVRRVTVCLGCRMPVEADCGCPAGTYEQLVNRRAETAEVRVRELERVLKKWQEAVPTLIDILGAQLGMDELAYHTDNALANIEKED